VFTTAYRSKYDQNNVTQDLASAFHHIVRTIRIVISEQRQNTCTVKLPYLKYA